jgi:hypothetical protein
MTLTPVPNVANSVAINQEEVLKALNLNPRDPNVQALVLVCQQYDLDPVLKHAVLIKGNLYVTRDGLLHVAHKSGRLDGIVVEDEGETAKEWWAKVTVHVKGQTHGYSYKGRYPKSGHQTQYGPEMAVKCAEVMALRRAFGVTGIATVEEQWDKADALEAAGEIVAGGTVAAYGEEGPSSEPPATSLDDAVPSFTEHRPLEGWEKALHASMGEVFGSLPKNQMDAYRRRLVLAVSGELKSSRALTPEERQDFHAMLAQFHDNQIHFAPDGDDWKIEQGPAPEPSLTEALEASLAAVPDPEEDEAISVLREAIGQVAGLGEARVLKRARRIAEDNGWPAPEAFDQIAGDTLATVMAEVLAKIDGAD